LKIEVSDLRNAEVIESVDGNEVVLRLTEMDGNYYGSSTEIKLPAKSFKMLREAIVEGWLEEKKNQI